MTVWQPKDAKKFGLQAKLNMPYYTIETSVNPWGEEPLWKEWVFTGRLPIFGTPTVGGVDAQSACRRFGPMYDEKPGRHIRPMFECDDDEVYATPGDILKVRNSRRAKARR
ncbi:hypothetical protein OIU91_06070 [Streptomyces sp. NBC_01456]|uniref:hypothetical protein n=1 Tax=Streptomyces sp. NBC_01456 TaxID=2975868 RepID=UPI002E319EDE|nr:hypothetical protein [Streptomyces sp. NBC_01456]